MYSEWRLILCMMTGLTVVSCSSSVKLGVIERGETSVEMSLPSDEELAVENEGEMTSVAVDTSRNGEPYIMRAIKDEQSGEMVATDVISASKVTARFRHVAERLGKILLEFDISVPEEMMDSKWQLRFFPTMKMMGDSLAMEPLYITGRRYREAQLRGYQRYEAFLRSIITDTTRFINIHQLEIFLKRNFPETYAMKNDTSFVSEPEARNLFGVSQRQALEHYTSHFLIARNERRKGNMGKMFKKYVKSPIETDGIRLDTVLNESGLFVFRYRQQLASRPGLKKIVVSLRGEIYDFGKCLGVMPYPEDLVFYVSSLSSLTDASHKFLTRVLERRVSAQTLALIDFDQGSAQVDTTLEGNAQEMERIRECIGELASREEFEPDSIVVTASCSPEGSYRSNANLASRRAEALAVYIDTLGKDGSWKMVSRSVPENWERFGRLVASDTTLSRDFKRNFTELLSSSVDRDILERKLSKMPEYPYLRRRIYPRLRTVSLEFHLHRKGMVKDTIVTTEPDTLYERGVTALRNLDYKTACTILRPYRDYNAALALLASAYNWSALEILDGLDQSRPDVLYLKAIAYARLGNIDAASRCYLASAEADPSMAFRANLDPELSDIVRRQQSAQ